MYIQVCTVNCGQTYRNKFLSFQITHLRNISGSLFHHIYRDKFTKGTFWNVLKDKDWKSSLSTIVQHETSNILSINRNFKSDIHKWIAKRTLLSFSILLLWQQDIIRTRIFHNWKELSCLKGRLRIAINWDNLMSLKMKISLSLVEATLLKMSLFNVTNMEPKLSPGLIVIWKWSITPTTYPKIFKFSQDWVILIKKMFTFWMVKKGKLMPSSYVQDTCIITHLWNKNSDSISQIRMYYGLKDFIITLHGNKIHISFMSVWEAID